MIKFKPLKIGSVGGRVYELQRLLGIDINGSFCDIVKSEVIAYQLSKRLKADGVVDEKTWIELNK